MSKIKEINAAFWTFVEENPWVNLLLTALFLWAAAAFLADMVAATNYGDLFAAIGGFILEAGLTILYSYRSYRAFTSKDKP